MGGSFEVAAKTPLAGSLHTLSSTVPPAMPHSTHEPSSEPHLDFGDVEEAGRVAHQRATREGQGGDGLIAALVQRARAVLLSRSGESVGQVQVQERQA